VPGHRVLSHAAAAAGEYPTEFKDEIAYHAAWLPTLTLTLAGPLLGIGRSALNHVGAAAHVTGAVSALLGVENDVSLAV
jgi:hypothetical protein